jgi:hypothetical protein
LWGDAIDDMATELLSHEQVTDSVFQDIADKHAEAAAAMREDGENASLDESLSVTAPMVHAVHDRLGEIMREMSQVDTLRAPATVGRAFNNSLSARLVASAGASHSNAQRAEAVQRRVRHHIAEQSQTQRLVQGGRRFLDFVQVPFLDSFKDGVALAMERSAEEIADDILERALHDAVEEYEAAIKRKR